ncbi:hypothetical protein DFH06DRAFT_1351176 [Mycena polygramma]|nr:hypothetical protein DFH06DRAFT_1351176 [Mycena polygramma]
MAHQNPAAPQMWVKSAKGALYWRHRTMSFWKGPRNDRVWVPSLDTPVGLPAPPDDFSNVGDYEGAPSAPVAPVAPPPAPTTSILHPFGPRPNPFASSPPSNSIGYGRRDDAPFSGSSGPPPYARVSDRGYTGPFARTFRDWEPVPNREQGREDRDSGRDNRGPPHQLHGDSGRPYRSDQRNEFGNSMGSQTIREEHRTQSQEIQTANRERVLRERLGSRGASAAPATPTASHDYPKVEDAKLDNGGNPQLPHTGGADDESEYKGTSPSEDEGDALKKFQARETTRVSEARRKVGPATAIAPTATAPAETVGAGLWGRVDLTGVPAMRNLLRWMAAGCPRARAMFVYLRDYYGANPTARRSDGMQYLFRRQTPAESTWLVATTGSATPMSRRGNSTAPSRNERRRRAKAAKAGTLVLAPAKPKSEAPVGDPDVPMPGVVTEAPYERSYLGTAPLPESPADYSSLMGPHAPLTYVLEQLTRVPPREWAQGVRLWNGEWPTADSPIGSRPLVGDVLAARLVNFLAPARDDQGSLHRIRFVDEALLGFSVFGLFERFVTRGNYVADARPIERYGFDGTNLEMSHALAYIVQHGMHPGSAATTTLHAYATSWRNRRDSLANPTLPVPAPHTESFNDNPRHHRDVLNWPDSRITQWNVLSHGPVRPGVSTTYPRFPARLHPVPIANDNSVVAPHEGPTAAMDEDTEMVPAGGEENPADEKKTDEKADQPPA